MPDCPASGQSGTGMEKNADARTSPERDPVRKGTQSDTGMLRSRIEMSEPGIPMTAASGLMPMPSYDGY
jgi:hypothetical protein